MKLQSVIFIFFLIGYCEVIHAQNELGNRYLFLKDTTKYWPEEQIVIQTEKGYQYEGRFFDIKDAKVYLVNGSDTIILNVLDIHRVVRPGTRLANISPYEKEIPEKMLITPTNSFLEEGQWELNNYYVFVNHIKYGITDKYNLGFGMSFIPSQSEQDTNAYVIQLNKQIYFLTQKVKLIGSKHFELSMNNFILNWPRWNVDSSTTIKFPIQMYHIVSASYFTSRFNFTASIGQGYYGSAKYGRLFRLFGSTNNLGNVIPSQFPVFNTDYIVGLSWSYDLFTGFSLINENIFFKGLWNMPGQSNTLDKSIVLLPIGGARYYRDYYSASLGAGPRFFYFDLSYYF